MVRRRAIGASVAAALVFSSMLLSNFALLASAGQRERLSITADSESLLADTGTVLAGTEGVGLLYRLQDFLTSRHFMCSSAIQEIGSFVEMLAASVGQGGITVRESLSMGEGQSGRDNLSTLSPFNGSSADGLSLNLRIQWSGESPLRDVAYDRTEVHGVNLPVKLDLLTSLCKGAVKEVISILNVTTFPACNASAVSPPLTALTETLRSQASKQGLTTSIEYKVVQAPTCTLEFTVLVSQPGAKGPEGAFTTSLAEEGSASIRVGA